MYVFNLSQRLGLQDVLYRKALHGLVDNGALLQCITKYHILKSWSHLILLIVLQHLQCKLNLNSQTNLQNYLIRTDLLLDPNERPLKTNPIVNLI